MARGTPVGLPLRSQGGAQGWSPTWSWGPISHPLSLFGPPSAAQRPLHTESGSPSTAPTVTGSFPPCGLAAGPPECLVPLCTRQRRCSPGLGVGHLGRGLSLVPPSSAPKITWFLKPGSSPSWCQVSPGLGTMGARVKPLGAAWILTPALASALPCTRPFRMWRPEPSVQLAGSSHGGFWEEGHRVELRSRAQISVTLPPLDPLLRKSKKEEKGLMSALQKATCVNTESGRGVCSRGRDSSGSALGPLSQHATCAGHGPWVDWGFSGGRHRLPSRHPARRQAGG